MAGENMFCFPRCIFLCFLMGQEWLRHLIASWTLTYNVEAGLDYYELNEFFGLVFVLPCLVGGLEHVYFSIYWESSSQLTNIFQRGWNHQPNVHRDVCRHGSWSPMKCDGRSQTIHYVLTMAHIYVCFFAINWCDMISLIPGVCMFSIEEGALWKIDHENWKASSHSWPGCLHNVEQGIDL